MITDEERRDVAKLLRERAGYEMGCVLKELYGDCNSAGPSCGECNERAMRYVADLIEPSEPKVKCVAEVKIDGGQLEKLVHDAVVELTGIDREVLLALADEMEIDGAGALDDGDWCKPLLVEYASRIRKALGVDDGD